MAKEEGGYGTAGGEDFGRRLRLEEVVLLQLDAAGHGGVLDREEALALGEHVGNAVLHEEGEVWESMRESDGNMPAAAAHVDHGAIEGVPGEQVTECARLAVDYFFY